MTAQTLTSRGPQRGARRPLRAASRSVASHSASACSIAASSEWSLTSSNSAARLSRGRRSWSRLSINGPINSCRSPAISADTRLAIGVSVRRLKLIVGRGEQQVIADPVDQLAVGHRVGSSEVERLAAHLVAGGRAREHLDHVAFVDRARDVRCATPAPPAPAVARRASPGTGTTATGADHDRRAERHRARSRGQEDLLDREAAGEVSRGGAAVGDEAAEVDDSFDAGGAGLAREVLGRGALALAEREVAARRRRSTGDRRRRAPSSASGSRRRRCPSGRLARPSPETASPVSDRDAGGGRGGRRLNPRTVWPSRSSRGARREPTNPVMPVTRTFIAVGRAAGGKSGRHRLPKATEIAPRFRRRRNIPLFAGIYPSVNFLRFPGIVVAGGGRTPL